MRAPRRYCQPKGNLHWYQRQNLGWLECGRHGNPGSVTGLLVAWGKGDEARVPAADSPGRAGAAPHCETMHGGERAGHSLQATALVNRAYLRLIDVQHVNWQDRAHFLAMSARLMRRILVDWARSKQYQKRGGGALKVTFDEALRADERGQDHRAGRSSPGPRTFDERKSKVIELRFFGGLSVEETARC